MTKFAVQAGALHPALYAGRVNKGATEFLEKEDLTDEILLAVARYVQEHWDGGLTMDFKKPGEKLVVNIQVTREREGESEFVAAAAG